MTPIELDQAVRRILGGVTMTTSLQATADLVALGFSPPLAFAIICRVLNPPVESARTPAESVIRVR